MTFVFGRSPGPTVWSYRRMRYSVRNQPINGVLDGSIVNVELDLGRFMNGWSTSFDAVHLFDIS